MDYPLTTRYDELGMKNSRKPRTKRTTHLERKQTISLKCVPANSRKVHESLLYTLSPCPKLQHRYQSQ